MDRKLVIVLAIMVILGAIVLVNIKSDKDIKNSNEVANITANYNEITDETTGEKYYQVYDEATGEVIANTTDEASLQIYKDNPDYIGIDVEEKMEDASNISDESIINE